MKFRFEIRGYERIKKAIDDLIDDVGLAPEGMGDYDYAEDIGHGQDSRFLGPHGHGDTLRRREKAFNFLHAGARLYLDCLQGPDANGYYVREEETQSTFSDETSLEQYHHLFCNMTGVPTNIRLCFHPPSQQSGVFTRLQWNIASADPAWQEQLKVPVMF